MLEGIKLQEGGNGVVSTSEVQVFGTFRGNEWSNKGEVVAVKEVDGKPGIWGFEVKVLGSKEYFIEKSGCESSFELPALKTDIVQVRKVTNTNTKSVVSPLSLLKNPMILIAGASMIIVFGLPYLMDNSTSTFAYLSVFVC